MSTNISCVWERYSHKPWHSDTVGSRRDIYEGLLTLNVVWLRIRAFSLEVKHPVQTKLVASFATESAKQLSWQYVKSVPDLVACWNETCQRELKPWGLHTQGGTYNVEHWVAMQIWAYCRSSSVHQQTPVQFMFVDEMSIQWIALSSSGIRSLFPILLYTITRYNIHQVGRLFLPSDGVAA